jgi:hypothetical protein
MSKSPDDIANIIIWMLIPGFPMRQTRAVIQAPRPKKKIINPGITNSRRNRPRPRMNQNSSGRDKTIVTMINKLKLLAR